MKRAEYSRYLLHFKEDAGTSRGVLKEKETFFVKVWDESCPEVFGMGECALFRGLSADDRKNYEEKLEEVCQRIEEVKMEELEEWSSIRFGVEMALQDLAMGGCQLYFPSAFTEGRQAIEINGLIWMGDKSTMLQRIQQKLEAGFHCIKLKIGAIDFEAELSLLQYIRERFSREKVELRVDANGAFAPEEAMSKLEALAAFGLHSIEQPIRQGQWEEMAHLCRETPIPIALDEELIGVYGRKKKLELLEKVQPQYIILKPALCGGFSGAREWIELAEKRGIGWWVTSALESNIGLNALAQWVATLGNPMPQGLGTGQLYTNNLWSPLRQEGECLIYGK
ncbi:MAG: o-succinylbenzoate synthase [Odoribacter sp.]|nr:o-succinylbenzoate synthase [Odoribacter sp.]MDY3032314.1 o-succinylbenzoate synthase [Odoribacter sp.]